MISSAIWLPLATLVLGYVGSLITESRRDIRAARREREVREQDRAQAISDRRSTFQRQTLLGLQQALYDLIGIASESYSDDYDAFQKTGNWVGTHHDETLRKAFKMQARIITLQVRADDEQLRKLVEEYREAVSDVIDANSEKEAEVKRTVSTDKLRAANDRLGELLRAIY